ncbi:MAG: methionine adenosyltransferase, partial [Clostridia bacterium]|nr:methionine adenosyltransferase [Clostridia bacterium]
YVDIPRVVRETIREIGYTRAKFGFDGDTCAVVTAIDEQSPDIALGVNRALEVRDAEGEFDEADSLGAGDQGMMFGYATTETPEYMPLPISLAHALVRRLAQARKTREIPYLRPDGKSQVTVEYENGRPIRVEVVVLSTQHRPDVDMDTLREEVMEKVIRQVVPPELIDARTRFYINPTGRFVIGGPQGDTGLTGRKIIVDTYGGMARHGGGSFSGKDPTKVDRSGTYAARWVAKNLVAAGLAERCEVQIAYAIGVARPLAVNVDTFGTGRLPEAELARLVERHFDLRPGAIIRDLQLRRPLYRQVAAYGHFGRPDLDLPWERLDKV